MRCGARSKQCLGNHRCGSRGSLYENDPVTNGEYLLGRMPEVWKRGVDRSDEVLRLGSVQVGGPKLKPKVWGQDLIERIEITRSAIHQAHESENNFLVSVQIRIGVLCNHFSSLVTSYDPIKPTISSALHTRSQIAPLPIADIVHAAFREPRNDLQQQR